MVTGNVLPADVAKCCGMMGSSVCSQRENCLRYIAFEIARKRGNARRVVLMQVEDDVQQGHCEYFNGPDRMGISE